MLLKPGMRAATACALMLFATGGAVAQRQPPAGALEGFQLGEWRLKASGGGERRLCVANRWAVLQIMHGNTQCQHFVVENGSRSATVRYTCPGHGHGRTSLSVETPRLMQIQTQGVRDGAPFSETYEARRLGNCN